MLATASRIDDVIDDSLTEETDVLNMNGHAPEAATEEPPTDEAPAKDPLPLPTPNELRALHYAEVIETGKRVNELRFTWEGLKKEASDAKKEFDGATVMLLRLMSRDPLQRQLPIETHPEFEHKDEPLPADDSWRKLPASVLGIKESWCAKLDSAGYGTLGELQDLWTAGGRLREKCDGIGEATDAAIVDAFSEYGAQHPEVFGEKQPIDDAPAEDDDESEAVED